MYFFSLLSAERLIFMIRCSFQDLSRSAFIQLYEALLRPHLECGMPACSPNLMADINHVERLGLHSLQRRWLRVDLIFTGLLDVDPNLFFLPPRLPHWISLPRFSNPPPNCTTPIIAPPLYVTQIPVLSKWFLQARCGLLFTIINYNQCRQVVRGKRNHFEVSTARSAF